MRKAPQINTSVYLKNCASFDFIAILDEESGNRGTGKPSTLWTVIPLGSNVPALPVNAIQQIFLLWLLWRGETTARRKRVWERARTHTLPIFLPAPRLPSPKFGRLAHADSSRGRAGYLNEAITRACCRRPVLPPPLLASPCNVAAAAPIVLRRGRPSARYRLLSRTMSESAARPREADGAIAHVGRWRNRHLLCSVCLSRIVCIPLHREA